MFSATKRRIDDDDDDYVRASSSTSTTATTSNNNSNSSQTTATTAFPAEPVKRMNLHHSRSSFGADQTMSPSLPSTLPSITYASPDYRPPPRSDALWLQPVHPSPVTMMDEDLTDEEALLTPSAVIQSQNVKDLAMLGASFSQTQQL
ncbi:hypothetical protein BX666DRAFT_2024209 [Dichotomocladium elegans]|nr:hypothetical protein BX666DRAFT_2024209 [Dichotomocladium elegans]